jgi:hypothetical protein
MKNEITDILAQSVETVEQAIRSVGMLIGIPLGMLLVVAASEVPYYWRAWKKAQAWKEKKRHER